MCGCPTISPTSSWADRGNHVPMATSARDLRRVYCKEGGGGPLPLNRGLARDVIGHVIHRKPPSLGASDSSFVRDLVEYTLCFELRQEFWKGQDR